MKALRRYFDSEGFVEVDTPALQVCPVMDAHIHAFQTVYDPVDKSEDKALYLHTSPEFDMKKLLTAGMERIYQICHVYRNGESTALHSPEFTLLEWYRAGSDYHDLMHDCENLIRDVSRNVEVNRLCYKEKVCNPFSPFQRLSVAEAFREYAQIDLPDVLDDIDAFAEAAGSIGVRVCESDLWDDIFHAVMAEKIEPYLGQGTATILYDYPVSMAALSRKKPDDPRFAERFELYICGVEVANAFSELADAQEQRRRYDDEMRLKEKLYGVTYPPDEEFFKALEHGMPESAGIALGIDRLIMLLSGAEDIHDVLWAPVSIS